MNTCIVAAGYCPKPRNTIGEPHYCCLPDLHNGDQHGNHKCRECGNEFETNPLSFSTWVIESERQKAGYEPCKPINASQSANSKTPVRETERPVLWPSVKSPSEAIFIRSGRIMSSFSELEARATVALDSGESGTRRACDNPECPNNYPCPIHTDHRDIHIATRSVQVWVDVDAAIADLVEYLNAIPGVRTHTSCQGTIGEGGAEPYRAYVECSWTPEAYARLQREGFEITFPPECNRNWGRVHPKEQS